MTDVDGTAREQYIEGLRMLADLMEAHPELPVPFEGARPDPGQRLTFFYLMTEDPKADLAAFARAMPGPVSKTSNDMTYSIWGQLAGLYVQASAYRDAVCEKVVLGVETVTEMVPDPDAPLVQVTTEVERVDWVCSPILSADDAAAVTR